MLGETGINQEYDYSLTAEGVIIHQYFGSEPHLRIPASLEGCPVVALGGAALARRNLLSVHLPDTMQRIGLEAFKGNAYLAQVNLPNCLESIADRLFIGCRYLKEILIPASVKRVGLEAFRGCSNLEKVVFQGRDCQLGTGVFHSCLNLKEIILPAEIEILPARLWENCETLKRIELPATVKQLGEGMFMSCKALEELLLPPEIEELPERFLEYCTSLTKIIIPERVKKIADYALSWCSNLTELKLPSNLQEIGFKALVNCRGLTELVFPERVKFLPNGALDKCSSLKQIRIPASVTQIGSAFMPLEATLEQIKVDPQNLVYKDLDGILFSKDGKSLLEYPSGRRERSYTIPEGTESLGNGAFYANQFLNELHFPASLRRIEREALAEMKLARLEIPLTVEEIGLGCFKGIKEVIVSEDLDLSGKIKPDKGFLTVVSRQKQDPLYRIWLGAAQEKAEYPKLLSQALSRPVDLSLIDGYFAQLQNFTNQYQIALSRLEYPLALSPEKEQVYREFWQANLAQVLAIWIKQDDLSGLLTVEKLGLVTQQNIAALIEVANHKQAFKFLTELMDYQHRYLELNEADWEI